MDARMLRELELLPVARLYGFEAPGAQDEARGAQEEARGPGNDARDLPAAIDVAQPGVRMLVFKRSAAEPERWVVVADSFDGAAGALLDNMLAAVGARREGGPAPLVDRDLKRLAAKVVVAAGPAAATRLLESESDLAALRGQVHRYNDMPVVVTHDPAQLLGRAADKAAAWKDLLLARRTAAGDA